MPENKEKKRIKVSKASPASESQKTKPTSINDLLNNALSIISSELTQYKQKTDRNIMLNLKEARVIANYMDTLTRASKEAREQARAQDLSDLSDEELMQLAAQLGKSSVSLPKPKVAKDLKSLGSEVKKPDPEDL